MIRRPPRSTLSSSSAASDVYKRQLHRVECRGQLQKLDRLQGFEPSSLSLILVATSPPSGSMGLSHDVIPSGRPEGVAGAGSPAGSIRPETILRLAHQPRFTMRSRWRQGASKIPDDSRHHALLSAIGLR